MLKFEQRSGRGGAQSCIPLAADIRDKLNWMAVAKMEAVFPCDSLFKKILGRNQNTFFGDF